MLDLNQQGISRRVFLDQIRNAGLSFMILTSNPLSLQSAASATASDATYDISYIWHKSLENVLDYMEEVGEALGNDARRKLRVVKGKNNFGLIYDLNGNSKSAGELAIRHNRILQDEDLGGAVSITHSGYEQLYNISYGIGPNIDVQKINFNVVLDILGAQARKNLVIEETLDGNYALVYKSFTGKKTSFKISKQHNLSLSGKGVSASIMLEQGNSKIYGISSLLHDEINNKTMSRPQKPYSEHESLASSYKNLELRVKNFIIGQRKKGKLESDETTSWSAYDLTSGKKLVAINEDSPMQAASMVKPLIALAFFHEVQQGRLEYGKLRREKLRLSIQKSSNESTNWEISQLGGPSRAERILLENYGHLFKNTSIVERIPAGGRSYGNKASAHDYGMFLHALWNGQLPYSGEIKRLMALPKRNRLYSGALRVPEGTLVYDKTGSTARLCGDMGILVAWDRNDKAHPYTLVGIIQKESRSQNYGEWMSSRGDIIREVSNIVYDFMKSKYNLV